MINVQTCLPHRLQTVHSPLGRRNERASVVRRACRLGRTPGADHAGTPWTGRRAEAADEIRLHRSAAEESDVDDCVVEAGHRTTIEADRALPYPLVSVLQPGIAPSGMKSARRFRIRSMAGTMAISAIEYVAPASHLRCERSDSARSRQAHIFSSTSSSSSSAPKPPCDIFSLRSRRSHRPEYLAVNPNGVVPAHSGSRAVFWT
jgi:hypothetical protein